MNIDAKTLSKISADKTAKATFKKEENSWKTYTT